MTPKGDANSKSHRLSRRDVLGVGGVSLALFVAGCAEDGPAEGDTDPADADAETNGTDSGDDGADESNKGPEDSDDTSESDVDENDVDDEVETSEADSDEESEDDETMEEEEDDRTDDTEEGGEETGDDVESDDEGTEDDDETEVDEGDEENEDEEGDGEDDEDADSGDEEFADPDALTVFDIYRADEEFPDDRVQLYNTDPDLPVDISGWEFDTGARTVTVASGTHATPDDNIYVILDGEGLDPEGGTLTITRADGEPFESFEYDPE